jgi:hypothetical protein
VEIQTVVFDAGARATIVITNRNGKRSKRNLAIIDPHAALTWCERRACGFVYVPKSRN